MSEAATRRPRQEEVRGARNRRKTCGFGTAIRAPKHKASRERERERRAARGLISRVWPFSAPGRWTRTPGDEGDGPGERQIGKCRVLKRIIFMTYCQDFSKHGELRDASRECGRRRTVGDKRDGHNHNHPDDLVNQGNPQQHGLGETQELSHKAGGPGGAGAAELLLRALVPLLQELPPPLGRESRL